LHDQPANLFPCDEQGAFELPVRTFMARTPEKIFMVKVAIPNAHANEMLF